MQRIVTLTVAASLALIAGSCGDAAGPDEPVTADAGVDLLVSMGETVTLDASQTPHLADYEGTCVWRQIAGPSVMAGGEAEGMEVTIAAPQEVGTLAFELSVRFGNQTSEPDTVRVLVLEDARHAYFVGPTGDNIREGTMAEPMRTIQAAIDRAVAERAGADIYIAAGMYRGSLTLGDGVSLYGGFDPVTWVRDPAEFATTVSGGSQAVVGEEVQDLTIDGLVIESGPGVERGLEDYRSSYGILLRGSQNVTITHNRIRADAGASGDQGFGGWQGRSGYAGDYGRDGSCDGSGWGAGGVGGSGWPHAGGAGGRGGSEGDNDGYPGAPGQDSIVGGAGGAGGAGGSTGRDAPDGKPGLEGSAGAHGVGGASFGQLDPRFGYLPAAGATGDRGGSGGGGGGGGGQGGAWVDDGAGDGGGGGGGGGAGGFGGAGGLGGGGSLGIVVLGSTDIVIVDNEITTGDGGDGGRGGPGGLGGDGGVGGKGSTYCRSEIGAGGDGGLGGAGGAGGAGGGGGGGPSIGILADAASAVTEKDNVFEIGDPGAGGESPGGPEYAGGPGEVAEVRKLET